MNATIQDLVYVLIAEKINETVGDIGVHARVDFQPLRRDNYIKCVDIVLSYDNYYRIERFNNSMNITEEDVERIAKDLVKALMCDYFEARFYRGEG